MTDTEGAVTRTLFLSTHENNGKQLMKLETKHGTFDLTISLGMARGMANAEIIDLVNISNFQDIANHLINPLVTLDILWFIVKKQVPEGLSREDFEDSLGLDLQPVFKKVQESAVAFIRALEPNTGAALEKALSKMGILIGKRADALIELVDSDKLEKSADREIAKVVAELEKSLDENL